MNTEFTNSQYSEILKLRAELNYQLNNYIEVLDDLDFITNLNDDSVQKSVSSELHYRSRQLFMKYNNDI